MKKAISVLLIIMMVLAISTSVFAINPNEVSGDTTNTTAIQNIGKKIVGIVQVVGTFAAVIVLIVLGIKYMMGSAEEKAEYKKTLIPYIIGAVMIFAASNLAGIIYSWATTIGK